MAIDPNIKKKADDIRNKIYGKEVRESLASGLEEMSSDVVENEGRQSVVEGRQDSVESQWQAVSAEMTDKDVISAPEIIAARGGEANLKARLDKEHQDVTAQLAQTNSLVDILNKKTDGVINLKQYAHFELPFMDGVDWSPVFNQAFYENESNNNKIFIVPHKENVYLNSVINLPDNVTVIGDHKTTFKVTDNILTSVFKADNKKNIKLMNLNIIGTGRTNRTERLIHFLDSVDCHVIENVFTSSTIAVHFDNSYYCTATKNKIDNIVGALGVSEGYGVLASMGGNHIIKENHFNDVTRHCVYLSSGCRHTLVNKNEMYNSLKNPIQLYSRIDQQPTKFNTISDNTVFSVKNPVGQTDQAQGIVLMGFCENNLLKENVLIDIENEGIKITSDEPSRLNDYTNFRNRKNKFLNNVIKNASIGITLKIADDSIIVGNTIEDCTVRGIQLAAFGTGQNIKSFRNVVNNNIIINATDYGIAVVDSDCVNTVVKGNTLLDNGQSNKIYNDDFTSDYGLIAENQIELNSPNGSKFIIKVDDVGVIEITPAS